MSIMLCRASNIGAVRQAFIRQGVARRMKRMGFSSVVNPKQPIEVERVRAAVQRLLEPNLFPQQFHHADHSDSLSYRHLNDALQRVQGQLEEARLCVTDCHECEEEHRQEEIQTADAAIDAAVAALVDLLDALRHANIEDKGFAAVREETVLQIKKLRQDLDSLRKAE